MIPVSWQKTKTQSGFNFFIKTALMLETNIIILSSSHIYFVSCKTQYVTYSRYFQGPKSLACFVFSFLPWTKYCNTGTITALTITAICIIAGFQHSPIFTVPVPCRLNAALSSSLKSMGKCSVHQSTELWYEIVQPSSPSAAVWPECSLFLKTPPLLLLLKAVYVKTTS